MVQNMDMDIPVVNNVIIIEAVKVIFKDMFKRQQRALLNIVTINTTYVHHALENLSIKQYCQEY